MIVTIGRTKILRSAVSRAVTEDAAAFFAACDAGYERRITDIVRRVCSDVESSRLILLSGPSASGKTTTSFKIKQALERAGIRAVTISMDDFFKDRDAVPALPDGSRDYESLQALDLACFDGAVSELIVKGHAEFPVFNFKTGRRENAARLLDLPAGSVAVVEGLHALDPAVTDGLPSKRMLRLYVSVSSDFIDDDGKTVLTAREVRLIRRMVRDYHFRGSSPDNTMEMWEGVCRGEDRYVRPFKRCADITVNSVLRCEPCIFRRTARELLAGVAEQSPHYETAGRLAASLEAFAGMDEEIVPSSCMLREFLGGSIYFNKSAKKDAVADAPAGGAGIASKAAK